MERTGLACCNDSNRVEREANLLNRSACTATRASSKVKHKSSLTLRAPSTIVKISTTADIAIAQLKPIPRDIPPIPIHEPTHPVKAGIPVVILGYPVGVEALLARMDASVVESLLKKSGQSLKALVQDVADREGIRPLANQGHIGDVVPGQIVYDAPTTGGASGSPVFNTQGEVIAVNAMIMTRFGGANSGIPIELVQELLSDSS